MAIMLDGNALAQRVREKVKQRITDSGLSPGLAIILVGTDPASHTYVGKKQQACLEVGIRFEKFLYPEFVKNEKLLTKIAELNARDDVHGILVQLPLPEGHDTDKIIAAIDPKKDVDGFHPDNLQRLKEGKPSMVPAVALAVMKLLGEAKGGKRAVIVSSDLFAVPLIELLKERGIAASVVHPDELTPNKTKTADILIVAVGQPGLITDEHVKSSAVVIDVGTTKVNGKLLGDVDQATVEPIAGALTPVPGGVGPMTVAMLLVNVLKTTQQFGSRRL